MQANALSNHSPQIHPAAKVHPRATVDPTAVIGEGAVIEADSFVGPHCVIGPHTRIRTRAVIVEHTRIGAHNDVHPCAVLGGDPQDRAFTGEIRGELHIGDRNIFREGVTLSRGTNAGPPTRVGHNCYFMAGAHAGHNAQIGDNCILVNNSALAGHTRIGNNVVLSLGASVHQFVNVGEGVMFQAGGAASMHVPPYVIVSIGTNGIVGLNRVGMRRNPNLTAQDRIEVKQAYREVYRHRAGESRLEAIKEVLAMQPWGPAARLFLGFIQDALLEAPPRARGVCGPRSRKRAVMSSHDEME